MVLQFDFVLSFWPLHTFACVWFPWIDSQWPHLMTRLSLNKQQITLTAKLRTTSFQWTHVNVCLYRISMIFLPARVWLVSKQFGNRKRFMGIVLFIYFIVIVQTLFEYPFHTHWSSSLLFSKNKTAPTHSECDTNPPVIQAWVKASDSNDVLLRQASQSYAYVASAE